MSTDLSQFEAKETGLVEILNQKDEPMMHNDQQVTIEVYGPGSEVYQKAQARIEKEAMNRAVQNAIKRKAGNDAEDARKQLVEKLVACTKSVNNFPGDARSIYTNPRLGFVTNQVARYIEDWSNF